MWESTESLWRNVAVPVESSERMVVSGGHGLVGGQQEPVWRQSPATDSGPKGMSLQPAIAIAAAKVFARNHFIA